MGMWAYHLTGGQSLMKGWALQVEARILLGDMAEGLGRGMLSNLGVGPFFVEVREVIAKVRTKRFN
jgi:hypothetical protein